MRDNYAAEIKVLAQHLSENPESTIFARLADRYLQLREVDKAMEISEKGLRKHPHYASAHFVLAKCYFARLKFDEAEKHLKRVLTIDAHFLAAHKLYGELMGRMGLSTRARNAMARVHALDPFFLVPGEEETFADATDLYPPPAQAAYPAAVTMNPEPRAVATPEPTPPADADPWAWAELRPEPLEAPASIEPPVSDYLPPVPEQDLEAFARDLEALEIGADEEPDVPSALLEHPIEPLSSPVEETRSEPLSDFEREEIHFTDILNDYFGVDRAEEEWREKEERRSIVRAAMTPEPEPATPPRPQPPADFQPEPPAFGAPEPERYPRPQPPADFWPEPPAFSRPQPPIDFQPEPLATPPPQPPADFQPEPPAFRAPEPESYTRLQPPPEPPAAGEREMSPLFPFRGDEEWFEDSLFAAPEESDAPVRLEPPSEADLHLNSLPDGATATAPTAGFDLLAYEGDEEEKFGDFLANLDRLGGAMISDDQEELTDAEKEEEKELWNLIPEPSAYEPAPPTPESTLEPPLAPTHQAPPGEEENDDKPKEKFVTPTLGEIYAAQGQYVKAIGVFEMLLKKNPDNQWYRTKLEYLRKRLDEEKH